MPDARPTSCLTATTADKDDRTRGCKPVKICINIKVWQRPEVFANVLRSIFDQQTKHDIHVIVALSPDDPYYAMNRATSDRYGAQTITIPNQPLSKKANELAIESAKLHWDFWMVLGSDDVVGPGFFDAYDFDKYKAWGWSDMYLWEPSSSSFSYWSGYDLRKRNESIGAGRVLSRDIMMRLDFRPHDDGLNRNLDLSTTKRLRDIGVEVPHGKLPDGVYLVDCKDSESITQMSAFRDVVPMSVPAELAGYLSQAE